MKLCEEPQLPQLSVAVLAQSLAENLIGQSLAKELDDRRGGFRLVLKLGRWLDRRGGVFGREVRPVRALFQRVEVLAAHNVGHAVQGIILRQGLLLAIAILKLPRT